MIARERGTGCDRAISKDSGQALLEMAVVLPLFAAVIAGLFWMFRVTALRTECQRVVFEAVRSELETAPERIRFAVRRENVAIRRTQEGVEGEMTCGSHRERLFLPHLGERKSGT